jgi:hypothetical protein
MKTILNKECSEQLYDQQVSVLLKQDYFIESPMVSQIDYVAKVIGFENLESDDDVFNHYHFEWIKYYNEKNIISKQDIESEILNIFNSVDFSVDIQSLLHNITTIYIDYLAEMETYNNAVMPSIESLKNTLKFIPFLICYKPTFYIDASTGYFGCSIRKKKALKKRKNLNLIFKSSDEIVYSLTERMNNIISLSGIADLDNDLEDAQAIKYILDM